MPKIAIDLITLEITRRCNMIPPCAHCFRGSAQTIDLNNKAIDNLLNQVEVIGELSFSGGEPLVNLPALEYVYNKIVQNGIEISHMSLITNGLICSDNFISIMKDFCEYIRKAKSKKDVPHITIGVSLDKYHHNNSAKEFISKCTSAFSGWPIVIAPHRTGTAPVRSGNAKSLPAEETLNYFSQPYNINAELYYWEPCDTLPKCAVIDPRKLCQLPIVVTPLYLSATGYLYNSSVCTNEYTYIDMLSPVCDLNTNIDIITAIDKYNTGRKSELECFFDHQSHKKPIDDLYEITDTFIRLNTAAQTTKYKLAQDAQIMAKKDMNEINSLYTSEPHCNMCIALLLWAHKTALVSPSNSYALARNDAIQQLRNIKFNYDRGKDNGNNCN